MCGTHTHKQMLTVSCNDTFLFSVSSMSKTQIGDFNEITSQTEGRKSTHKQEKIMGPKKGKERSISTISSAGTRDLQGWGMETEGNVIMMHRMESVKLLKSLLITIQQLRQIVSAYIRFHICENQVMMYCFSLFNIFHSSGMYCTNCNS